MNAFIAVISVLVAASQATVINPYANLAGLPVAAGVPVAAGAPLVAGAYAAPAAAVVPAQLPAALTKPSSQFQAQDELGNINYGYANVNSAKQEVGNTYGGVTGSYSYVDAYGIPQRVDYIADALGFRVKATNLPVAPVDTNVAPVYALKAPVFDLKAPEPVKNTPEVEAAIAEFQAKFDEAAAREKRSVVAAPAVAAVPGITALNAFGYNGLGLNAYGLGLNAYGLGLAAPAVAAPAVATVAAPAIAAPAVAAYAAPAVAASAISAPATRSAILTKIKLNPGHAVAYRVD